MKGESEKQVVALLKKPWSILSHLEAKQLHGLLLKVKPFYFPHHIASLISIYSDLNLLTYSTRLANFSSPSYSIFKSIIRCYSSHGLSRLSLQTFIKMKSLSKSPDPTVFPSLLRSCALLLDLPLAASVHASVIRSGCQAHLHTGNALMNVYARFRGGIRNVHKVFDAMPHRDVVSWNTVLHGCVRNAMCVEAVSVFKKMKLEKLEADEYTLSIILSVFTEISNVSKGKEIHCHALKRRLLESLPVASGVVEVYSKCNRVEDALKVFAALKRRDCVSWNSVICGCVRNGRFEEALGLFRRMLGSNVNPVETSFSILLPACSSMKNLRIGKELHAYITKSHRDTSVFICSALVDMYAKCGSIELARITFDKISEHDTVSMTAIVMAYAVHGNAPEAIGMFEKMTGEGIVPNEVSFTAILTACMHGGEVEEGWRYFNRMREEYEIVPGVEHYAAMADLLSRAGYMEEACELIGSFRGAQGSLWMAILWSCKEQGNVDLAGRVAEKIFAADPGNVEAHVVLCSLYASARKWKEMAIIRKRMKEKGLQKVPACSWIHVGPTLHAFLAGPPHSSAQPNLIYA